MTQNKKCILLVRVSTERQSFDEQEKELLDLARDYNYSDENIHSVAYKESAIKLSEEERAGLNDMKKLIETGEYDCVFAWETSRIARRKKILFSILEYLVERKIQLIIKEPRIVLLKKDGTIDEGAETMFTFFAQIAESEMRNKSARFARGRKRGYNAGFYMGGKITRGYKIGEDGRWELDEDDSPGHMGAPFVRLMFNMYNSGEYSLTTLASELQSRGYFSDLTLTNVKSEIYQMLRRPMYLGVRTNNNIYPQLIDKETWDKCASRRAENRHIAKSKTPHLLTPLIRCTCGASYSANLIDCAYTCRIKHNAVESGLVHSPNININMAESLAWYVALRELQYDMINKQGDAKAELEEEISVLEQKLSHSESVLNNTIQRKAELGEDYYVHGRFTREKYDEMTAMQNDIIRKERANIHEYEAKILQRRKQIESEVTFDTFINQLSSSYESLMEGTDMATMRKIVHRYITGIYIDYIPGRPYMFYKKIIFRTIHDENRKDGCKELSVQGKGTFDFIETNLFYVNTGTRKAFFDELMENEVPMVYIEREHNRRHELRKPKRKKS